jgi:carboxypeptidase Q
MSKRPAYACALAALLLAPISAEQRVARDVHAAIREEVSTQSQVMRTLHFLTDVYGPRVTGSPSLKAAGEWAVTTMKSWGLTNGTMEPWEFGHPGWVNERFAAHILSPVKDQLVAEVLAWTPGTDGTVTAHAFQLNLPDRPSAADLSAYLDSVKEQVRGKIVLADRSVAVAVNMNPTPKRRDDERVRQQFDPRRETTGRTRTDRRGASDPPPLTSGQISRRIDEFLVANGARARVNDARREHGQVAAFNNATFDITQAVPTVVMRNEDYGRIARILADGTPVELELTIVNTLHPEGRTAYNAIAEIDGTDKKDEIVLIGAHLDSWQSATGATDNAIGCAVMMEAARTLKALGVQPRRTIRVALWSGEEQGLLGSKAYVQRHFGSFENPRPGFFRLAAYVNLDRGTGRPRGATVFGPPEAAALIREALAPLADLGVAGAIATRSRNTGATDHTSFNSAGLPGIDFELDPIEYDSHTHHTNLDTYERVLESDVKASVIAVATLAYQLAMSEQMLPRFQKRDMPAPGGR